MHPPKSQVGGPYLWPRVFGARNFKPEGESASEGGPPSKHWAVAPGMGGVALCRPQVLGLSFYYYGMTAQLKAIADWFCAYKSNLN